MKQRCGCWQRWFIQYATWSFRLRTDERSERRFAPFRLRKPPLCLITV